VSRQKKGPAQGDRIRMRQERVAANGRPGGAQRNKTGRGTARRAPTQSDYDSATDPRQ